MSINNIQLTTTQTLITRKINEITNHFFAISYTVFARMFHLFLPTTIKGVSTHE